MFIRVFFPDFLYKSLCCGYPFESHNICLIKAYVVGTHLNYIKQHVDAIQMGTHNICLYKEVDQKYIGCNLMTTELLDRALIGVCAIIRSNTVYSKSLPLGYSDIIFFSGLVHDLFKWVVLVVFVLYVALWLLAAGLFSCFVLCIILLCIVDSF